MCWKKKLFLRGWIQHAHLISPSSKLIKMAIKKVSKFHFQSWNTKLVKCQNFYKICYFHFRALKVTSQSRHKVFAYTFSSKQKQICANWNSKNWTNYTRHLLETFILKQASNAVMIVNHTASIFKQQRPQDQSEILHLFWVFALQYLRKKATTLFEHT